MEKYIDQLIDDFQSSADSVKDLMDGKVYPEKPEDLQSEVDQALFLVLSEYLNILPIQFPPIEQLSGDQIRKIETAFTKLLKAYGFLIYFPPRVHQSLKYQTILKLLSREVPILTSYLWHIATCEYEPAQCPFGSEYCTCF